MQSATNFDKLKFYRHALPTLQNEIERNARSVNRPAGHYLFYEGDPCTRVAFVLKGSVRIFKTGASGRQISLYHVQPGESCVLNLSCALSASRFPANAVTTVPSELMLVEAGTLKEWMGKEVIRNYICQLFSRQLTAVISLIEEIVFHKMDQRLAEFLCQQFANGGTPRRVLRITHERIAAEVGTAREVVSRLIKEFDKSGAIQQGRGKIILRDEILLKQFCYSTGNTPLGIAS